MHENRNKKTVFVGLSGGVDSSVAAARLLSQGYRVVGVFIKVWQPDFLECNWEAERLDAMRVAATLDIPFLTCDASERYKTDVVDYLVREYKAGRTPNPDVMCNKHVKFGAFIDFAREHGADYIATGHYAERKEAGNEIHLFRGQDDAKDQSYFLWTLTNEQLRQTLLPIGDTDKESIRKEAAAFGLPTAEKPDSQGVCFLGALDMKSFLFNFIEKHTGPVVDEHGEHVGEHDGVAFYTIGQRHGFSYTHETNHDQPYYIISKNIAENILVVSHIRPLFNSEKAAAFTLTDTNWIGSLPNSSIEVQTRYHQKPARGTITVTSDTTASITLEEPLEMAAIGQSCVLYDGMRCLGGGIISEITI